MSDNIYKTMAGAFRQVNDVLRQTFARDGAVCYLLKRSEYSGRWSIVRELTTGYLVEYGNRDLREDIIFDCAKLDEDFPDQWAAATHLAYGVPDCDNQVFVYVFDIEQKDRTQPDAFSPTFKGFLSRVQNERFKVL